MTLMEATAHRTLAVETDTLLASAHATIEAARTTQARSLDSLHRQAGDTRRDRFSGPWAMSTDEVLAHDPEAILSYERSSFIRSLATYTEALTAEADAEAEIDRLGTIFQASGGWNRYFLVTNTGGHVHRGMDCTTCFPTTQYAWLVELADCDEAEMVASYGEMACTICFPDAPTHQGYADGTSALARISAAEKAEKAAAKQAKADAKAAKAITSPDGSALRTRGGKDLLSTLNAAKQFLTMAFETQYEHMLADVPQVAAAVAVKTGQSIEAVTADHKAKGDKKRAKW